MPAYIALIAVGVGLATGGGMESGRIAPLDRAEQRVSALAVAAERERIGRDLHDILGHSLTAISIKSALAAGWSTPIPAAAKAQIAEIEEIARQALGRRPRHRLGIREVRVATEIASARSVLLAAGIEAHCRRRAAADRRGQRAVRLRGPRGGDQRRPAQRGDHLHHHGDEDRVEVADDGSGLGRAGGTGLPGWPTGGRGGRRLRVDRLPGRGHSAVGARSLEPRRTATDGPLDAAVTTEPVRPC